MRYVEASIIVAAVALLASCESGEPEKSLLEQLAFQQDQLPKGCSIKSIKVVLPYGTVDLNVIPNLFQDDVRKVIDSSVVKAMLCAVYEEENEIGVDGWRLASEESATALHQKLMDELKPEPGKMTLWRHANHVVMLWRDAGTSDDCFNRFRDKIQQVLDADGNKDVQPTGPGARTTGG